MDMKDIKSLYFTAKDSGKKDDIASYVEEVNRRHDNDPTSYAANLEYIISTTHGASTLKSFIEKWGIPLHLVPEIHSILESCNHRMELRGIKNLNVYPDVISYIESIMSKYPHCMMMTESFPMDKSTRNDYIAAYYQTFETPDGTVRASTIPHLMINKFHESAIPDLMITANNIGGQAPKILLEYMDREVINDPVSYQHVYECCQDINQDGIADIISHYSENGLDNIVHGILEQKQGAYRESVLNGDENPYIEYTEAEIDAIRSLIEYKESKLTMASGDQAIGIYNEIMSLYPELDGLIDESGEIITESIFGATANQKKGKIPGYLGNNHDMSYGEDDSDSDDQSKRDMDDLEKRLEEHRRKSAQRPSSIIDDDDDEDDPDATVTSPAVRNVDDATPVQPADKPTSAAPVSSAPSPVNNYYYYSYMNSNNRNTNSYNRRTSDDHSRGKHIRSHINDDLDDDLEESVPWELQDPSQMYIDEGFKDIIKKGATKIKDLGSRAISLLKAKKSLKTIQEYDNPNIVRKRIPFTLPGTNIPIKLKFPNGKIVESYYQEAQVRGTLTSEEIKSAIKHISSKLGIDVIMINNEAFSANAGGALVVETTQEYIDSIRQGKQFDQSTMPNRLNSSGDARRNLQKAIMFDSNIISNFSLEKPSQLEIIIMHEYGHYKTFDKITDDVWFDDAIKRSLISQMAGIIQMGAILKQFGLQRDDIVELQLIYHKLPLERYANEYSNINPVNLIATMFGRAPTGRGVSGTKLDVLINWKIPDSIKAVNRAALAGGTSGIAALGSNLLDQYETDCIALYNQCITNDTLRSVIVSGVKSAMAMLRNPGSMEESVDAVMESDEPDKPKSDHPVQDTLQDIDREMTKHHQAAKKTVTNIQNTGRAIAKPFKRGASWIGKIIDDWKDKNENEIKEKMVDPRSRNKLMSAIKKAIIGGSLFKAGLLLNPVFLFLGIASNFQSKDKKYRIRNEIISELKIELEILDDKIKKADYNGDTKNKYKLMRFKNELEKKLLRVGGGKQFQKYI